MAGPVSIPVRAPPGRSLIQAAEVQKMGVGLQIAIHIINCRSQLKKKSDTSDASKVTKMLNIAAHLFQAIGQCMHYALYVVCSFTLDKRKVGMTWVMR
jgi:hypothetical protein